MNKIPFIRFRSWKKLSRSVIFKEPFLACFSCCWHLSFLLSGIILSMTSSYSAAGSWAEGMLLASSHLWYLFPGWATWRCHRHFWEHHLTHLLPHHSIQARPSCASNFLAQTRHLFPLSRLVQEAPDNGDSCASASPRLWKTCLNRILWMFYLVIFVYNWNSGNSKLTSLPVSFL